MNIRSILLAASLIIAPVFQSRAQVAWHAKLEHELPLLGHRNWIVIADSAYPWQTAAGIETINTGAEQLEVIKAVLTALDGAHHVKANIFLDAELAHVPEADAKGVSMYRDELNSLLGKRAVESLPHEQIIAKLDEAGKTFHVLLLKTKLTIPYTSVFLQLDCAYWDAGAEKRLREALKK
jgi:L-fucose mutarotase/ribose pyranase (RbsD/FucU family)